VQLPMLGLFNVHNALAAVTACGALDLPLAEVITHVTACHAIPGRLEQVPANRGFRVLVDYAHTDDALRNVLQTLRPFTKGRLILVFGCGGNRDIGKRAVMGSVADKLADYSVITTDNPRTEDPLSIIDHIDRGFESPENHCSVPDRAEAISHALKMAKKGDVVLVAGKGHETFQEFANTTVPFDDRQVVARLLEK
jgi:UDP-N-acetylmuramoyl-L-alanyl-D-glutamate--2,6-diaminopimelate ligase